MSKTEVYELLEDKMLRYSDLVDVPVKPNDEQMVCLTESNILQINPIDPNMTAFTGTDIYLRQEAAIRLGCAANTLLNMADTEMKLQIVYGYRALSIQTALFKRIKADLSSQYEGVDLMEAVHRMVAVPEVAGHPTGGAVDVQITREGKPLDFGTEIWEFAPDSYTFSPFISREAWFNRQLLRRIMTGSGFAPFDGEWWHFSYGDREWAKYYGKPSAIYEQIEFASKQS